MKKQHSHLFVTFVICIFICFGFSNLLSAQSWKESKKMKKILFNVKLRNEQVFEKIHFKLHRNQIIIPVTINGKTYNFIFDTGATVCIFSDSLANKLKKTHHILAPGTDDHQIEKTVNFYCTDSVSVQVGSLYFDNVGYGVVNLDKFEQELCIPIDGVLGVNILRKLNWEIDFFNQIINVSNKPFSANNYGMKIHFKLFSSRTPEVIIVIGRFSFYATLDMGSGGGISILESSFIKSGKSSYLEKSAKGIGWSGITLFNDETPAPVQYYMLEMDSLYIGKNRNNLIVNTEVSVSSSTTTIGNSFLMEYGKIAINWKQKKIFLGKKDENDTINNDMGSKVLEFAYGLQDDKLIVDFIWENADAYKKGVRIGDQIMSINGISTEKINNFQWCEIKEEIKNLDNNGNRIIELLTPAGEKITVNTKPIAYKSLMEN
jgi:hypothetical protein